MLNTKPSFNKFIQEFLDQNFPNFLLFSEPQEEQLTYPCVSIFYNDFEKTETLGLWAMQTDIHIMYAEFERHLCEFATVSLLRYMGLTTDRPGDRRRLPKYRFYNCDGSEGDTTQIIGSDILYYVVEDVQTIYERDYPELIHNTFSIELIFRDD